LAEPAPGRLACARPRRESGGEALLQETDDVLRFIHRFSVYEETRDLPLATDLDQELDRLGVMANVAQSHRHFEARDGLEDALAIRARIFLEELEIELLSRSGSGTTVTGGRRCRGSDGIEKITESHADSMRMSWRGCHFLQSGNIQDR
jgi:hypothetical protein